MVITTGVQSLWSLDEFWGCLFFFMFDLFGLFIYDLIYLISIGLITPFQIMVHADHVVLGSLHADHAVLGPSHRCVHLIHSDCK